MRHRILLAAGWYFPESIGGTEVYVRALAQQLQRRSVDVAVAAPAVHNGRASSYLHDGVPVFRYVPPVSPRGDFDVSASEPAEWCDILNRFSPTTVDLHSLVPGLGLPHLRAAGIRRARTVLTVHVPEVLCARSTLMRFGSTPCDGDLGCQPCTACRLHARGVPALVGGVLTRVGPSVARRMSGWPLPSVVTRSLNASSADRDRRVWFSELVKHADCVVAVSDWLARALRANGVSPDKLVLCKQGIDGAVAAPRAVSAGSRQPLRVGFVGRLEPRKGVHVLLEAASLVQARMDVEFHIWGIAQTPDAAAYRDRMIRTARASRRIFFHDRADASAIYNTIDVLVVPSIGFETGPLVVLEALAAGVPVIGSDLGGISERVTHEQDGLLIAPGDAKALARAITRLAEEPDTLASLRPRGPVRTMADVADEMLATYDRLAPKTAA